MAQQLVPLTPAEAAIVDLTIPAGSQLDGIVNHWTAGGAKASNLDKQHYMLMIEQDCTLVRGNHTLKDNLDVSDGRYALHTKHANTKRYGLSLCGMRGASQERHTVGPDPINEDQFIMAARVNAYILGKFGVEPEPKMCLTHAEVTKVLGRLQDGKWDIAVLPWDSTIVGATKIGNLLRSMVAEIMEPVTPDITLQLVLTVPGKPALVLDGHMSNSSSYFPIRKVCDHLGMIIVHVGRDSATVQAKPGDLPESVPLEFQLVNGQKTGFCSIRALSELVPMDLDFNPAQNTVTAVLL